MGDKEAKRKLEEEKKAAKQRAIDAKKDKKKLKKAAVQASGEGKDNYASENGIAKEQSQLSIDKNNLQTKKDNALSKKKKRRRLKGAPSQTLEEAVEAPNNVEVEKTVERNDEEDGREDTP